METTRSAVRASQYNMAGNEQGSDVRAVVENLVSHPRFQQIVSDAVSQSSNTSGVQACNNGASNASAAPVAARAGTTGTAFSGPQEEFRSLFRTGAGGRGGTVSSFIPTLGRNSNRWSRRQRSRSATSCRSSPVPKKSFSREVVLLSSSNDKVVVRGSYKADLMRRGQVIQSFDFMREWTEEEVFQHLRDAFVDVLQGTNFQIMLGIGNELVVPKLMSGQTLNGERMSKLFAQKIIWLVPDNDLPKSTAQHEKHKEPYSSGEGPSMPVPYSSGEGPSTPVLSQPRTPALEQPRILAQGQASSLAPTRCIVNTSNLHSSAYESQLRDMFPDENLEVIQSAIAGNYDITGAINHLLKVHDESSDEDIWSSPLATHKKVKLSPIEELRLFIGRVKKSQSEEELLITREKSFISQVLRRYKNPRFDLGCNLCVAFRSSGTYELGADAGGPTTEFFYNLMKELQSGGFNGIKFLEGEIGHLTPKLDYDLLSSSVFEIVGKMILHSVLNNCRGLAGLSPAVISYILSGSRDTVLEYLTVDDVPDPCLCNNLKELLTCGEEDLQTFTDCDSDKNIADILIASGFPHIEISSSNKALAYECCLTYEVITKRIPVLDDLRKGLASEHLTGKPTLLDLAAEHPEIRRIVFPDGNSSIDLHDLRKLINYHYTEDADALKAKWYFEKYLDELSGREAMDQECLNDLVQFWTGWPSLPTMAENMTVTFLAKEESKVLAVTDTCFQLLKIPVNHATYEEFRKFMDISVKYGKVGFGKL